MPEGIRDTSAQDVILNNPRRGAWLKWLLPAAALVVVGLLLLSALSNWLSAEASISSDRIRVATVERGRAYTRINRQDGKRNVTVTANVTPRRANGALRRNYPAFAHVFVSETGSAIDRRFISWWIRSRKRS